MTIEQKSALKTEAFRLQKLLIQQRISPRMFEDKTFEEQVDKLFVKFTNAMHKEPTINWIKLEKFINKAQWFFSCLNDEVIQTCKDTQP